MTLAVQLVLRALLTMPDREMYGLEIIRGAGLASGTVYPILGRLADAGWLTQRDENDDEYLDAKRAGRPRRSYYQITPKGTAAAREALARTAVQLAALGITEPGKAPENTA